MRGEVKRGADGPRDLLPAEIVPLRHPFALRGWRIRAVSIAPPRIAALIALRTAEAIDPLELAAALTEAPAEILAALRWPDVEAILERGLPLLPPDLRALLLAPAPDATFSSARIDAEAAADVGNLLPDDAEVDPADFLTRG